MYKSRLYDRLVSFFAALVKDSEISCALSPGGEQPTRTKKFWVEEKWIQDIPPLDRAVGRSVCALNVTTRSHKAEGTGFLCQIPVNGIPHFGLVTCGHVLHLVDFHFLEKVQIVFSEPHPEHKYWLVRDNVGLLRKSNQIIDAAFIELSPAFIQNLQQEGRTFLELDLNLPEDGEIYILQYPINPLTKNRKFSESWGPVLNSHGNTDTDLRFEWGHHKVSTEKGSSGAPLILKTGKVFGIHLHKCIDSKDDSNIYVKIRYLMNELNDKQGDDKGCFHIDEICAKQVESAKSVIAGMKQGSDTDCFDIAENCVKQEENVKSVPAGITSDLP